jgi:hypothetical protein
LIKKTDLGHESHGLFRKFAIIDTQNPAFQSAEKKVGMALRHSRNRKGTFILAKLQKKSIRENLIFDFEKADFVLRKILYSFPLIKPMPAYRWLKGSFIRYYDRNTAWAAGDKN